MNNNYSYTRSLAEILLDEIINQKNIIKVMEYEYIIAQSVLTNERGKHGPVHIKPIPNQDPYLESMWVQCSKVLSTDYPVGTKFRIRAKIIHPIGKRSFVSSHYTWPFEALKD